MVDIGWYQGAVHCPEENPCIGCSGRESQLDGVTRVEPDSLH
jgi:hypothetical protein